MLKRTALEFEGRQNFPAKVYQLTGQVIDDYGGKLPEYKFHSEYIFITQSRRWSSKITEIAYLNGTTKIVAHVPNTFKMREIKGKVARKIMDEHEAYIVANMQANLGHDFSIGSDPEIFVEDEKGEVIPAFKFLGGKKDTTVQTQERCKVYWDGFQAEFETSPRGCLEEHTNSISFGMRAVLEAAKKFNVNARLSNKSVMIIPAEELAKGKPEHVDFGCMPSLNAYNMQGLVVPGRECIFRPAGGHIHFGLANSGRKFTAEQYVDMVKALDAILGVACVSMFAKFDNPKRRELYGLAGEYRLPPHGLEYRALSNAWLIHPLICHMTVDLARKAVMVGRNGLLRYWKADEKETIETINTCNVEQARAILTRNEGMFKKILHSYYGTNIDNVNRAFKVWMEGLESIILDTTNVQRNWSLDAAPTSTNISSQPGKKWYTAIPTILAGKKVA